MGTNININNIYRVSEKHSNNIETLYSKEVVVTVAWQGEKNDTPVSWVFASGEKIFGKKSDTELLYTGTNTYYIIMLTISNRQLFSVVYVTFKVNGNTVAYIRVEYPNYPYIAFYNFKQGDVITLSYYSSKNEFIDGFLSLRENK